MPLGEYFSHPVNHFHGRPLPEPAMPAGYAALVDRFALPVPLPPMMAAIAERHHPVSNELWRLLTPRHRPADSLVGHLVFALKWEGLDLGVLARLFKVVDPADVSSIVRTKPTGSFARRIWFLFEWLTGQELDVPNAGKVRPVPVVDPNQQVPLGDGFVSKRHSVIDNLPGSRSFCPLVRWTPQLRAAVDKRFDARAQTIIGRTRKDLVTRAAAFLLLSDSKSSFAIEGERPSSVRAARWARAIGEAGRRAVSVDELERLRRLIIGDARFVKLGLRTDGGFVGTHDRETGEPIPDHISARAEDLRDLIDGIVAYDSRSLEGDMDPGAAAAGIAFGLVYIHPFADGNGRIHRWLIHHMLASAGYSPPGLVFPISAAMLRRLDEYRDVLESYSAALLPFIEWRATSDNNVEVLNDTADYYRYFDATRHAEFLYSCIEETVEHDLPDEVRFLERFDAFARSVKEIVEMPDRDIERLRGFLAQGEGRLSKCAREHEFRALSDEEADRMEALYRELFL
jgi:hypothetical protein